MKAFVSNNCGLQQHKNFVACLQEKEVIRINVGSWLEVRKTVYWHCKMWWRRPQHKMEKKVREHRTSHTLTNILRMLRNISAEKNWRTLVESILRARVLLSRHKVNSTLSYMYSDIGSHLRTISSFGPLSRGQTRKNWSGLKGRHAEDRSTCPVRSWAEIPNNTTGYQCLQRVIKKMALNCSQWHMGKG